MKGQNNRLISKGLRIPLPKTRCVGIPLRVYSVKQLRKLRKAKDQKAKYYFLLGVAQVRRQPPNLKRGILSLTKAVKFGFKTYECYWARGLDLLTANKPASALRDFNSALKLNPDEISGYFWRGHCYMVMKKWSAAIKDFKRCIKINPKASCGSPRLSLARAYYSACKYNLALKEYTTILNEKPWPQNTRKVKYGDNHKIDFYFSLARLYAAMGKTEEVHQSLKEALALSRGDEKKIGKVKIRIRKLIAKSKKWFNLEGNKTL